MPRYVALLRAINVGGRTVPMPTLKKLFEADCGCTNVSTFIASGNVLFNSACRDPGALETRIARSVQKALGYDVGTFIRTPGELAAVAKHRPFDAASEDDRSIFSFYVIFLPSPLTSAATAALLALQTSHDSLAVRGREIFWRVRGRLLDSQVKGTAMAKIIGVPTTMRNITTVRKLSGLANA